MTEEGTRDRWLILVAIGVGTFMSALDGSVVNTLLPVMAMDLHATVAGIEWVSTVYLLVVSSLLLGFGRAGDIYGNKKLYLLGFVVFVIGSALCGLAPTAGALIGLRGIQAIGAAMLFSNAPAILTKAFRPSSVDARSAPSARSPTWDLPLVRPSADGFQGHSDGDPFFTSMSRLACSLPRLRSYSSRMTESKEKKSASTTKARCSSCLDSSHFLAR